MTVGQQELRIASVGVSFDPSPLNAAILRAFIPSVNQARIYGSVYASTKFGKMRSSGKPQAGVGISRRYPPVATSIQNARATIIPTGLGWMHEKGRTGGYPIFPTGVKGFRKTRNGRYSFGGPSSYRFGKTSKGTQSKVLSYGPNEASAWAVGGSLPARPYMGDVAEEWRSVIFPRMAQQSLTRAGFSAARAIRGAF